MMGLPEGWVTGVPGLKRREQLKAIGNGVVPQQATEALNRLLWQASRTAAVAARLPGDRWVSQALPAVDALPEIAG